MQCRFYLFVLFVVLYVKADIDQTSITTGSYSTTGTASVSSFIQLTMPSTGQAGIALYSAQQTIANGFATTFDYNSNTCSSPGADGFTFLVSPNLTIIDSLSSGNALAIAGSANVAVVAFDLYNDMLSVCSTNTLTPLSWASSCVFTSIGTELRCSGSHTVHIVFIPPSSWQVWLDGTLKGNFTKDVTNTLTAFNNMTYVGFTGSTGPSLSMRQRVTAWSFSSSGSCSSSNGGCSLEATCTVVNGSVQCTCNEGYTGDGYSCTLNSPPVDVPIAQPVAVPIATPLSEPVAVPITPVDVPITSPQANPVTTPIAPPVTHPVSVPVSVPTIVPILECFDDLQNGTFIAYFGYNNTMGEQIVLPIGLMNTFGNPSFIGQPTTFVAGRTTFGYLWSGKTLIWTLTSFRLTLDTSDTSRKCPSFARFTLTFYTERELYEQEVNSISSGVANALDISRERVRVLSIKYTLVSRKRDLSVAELEMEIAGANSTQIDEPNAAESVQSLVEIAQNATALTQALDPNATSNIQYIGVKSSPTGVEQSGIAVPPVTTSGSPRSLINVSSSAEKQMVVSQLWHFLLLFIMVFVTVHHRL